MILVEVFSGNLFYRRANGLSHDLIKDVLREQKNILDPSGVFRIAERYFSTRWSRPNRYYSSSLARGCLSQVER